MQFEFIGGQLALDFVNTASNRPLPGEPDQLREHLKTYGDLIVWATEARALPDCAPGDLEKAARQHPKIAARTLEDARDFRESLYRIFTAFAAGKDAPTAPAEDMQRLNEMFRRANAHRTLCCNTPGTRLELGRGLGRARARGLAGGAGGRRPADLRRSAAPQGVRRRPLQLAVPRQQQEPLAPLVHDAGLRQQGEGEAPLRPAARRGLSLRINAARAVP